MLKNIRQLENVVPSQHQHFLLASSGSNCECGKALPYSPLQSLSCDEQNVQAFTPPPSYDWIFRSSGGVMPPLSKQQAIEGGMQPLVSPSHQPLMVSSNGHQPLRTCEQDDDIEKIKCVLVGDGAVGKTSLIVSYTTNGYPTEYVPTAFDNYSVVVTVDNKPVRLQLCDTAGQDDFDSLRPLCYPGSDVFLVCFSVVSPTSFSNVRDKWLPELRQHQPHQPILLVGTQSDLRTDVKVLIELAADHEQPVSEASAQRLARQVGADAYVESSALTQRNLKEVFDQALLAALQSKRNPRCQGYHEHRDGKTGAVCCIPDADGSQDGGGKAAWRRLCCFL